MDSLIKTGLKVLLLARKQATLQTDEHQTDNKLIVNKTLLSIHLVSKISKNAIKATNILNFYFLQNFSLDYKRILGY